MSDPEYQSSLLLVDEVILSRGFDSTSELDVTGGDTVPFICFSHIYML